MKHQEQRFKGVLSKCLQNETMTVSSHCLLVSCCDSLSNCHIELSPEKCRSYSVVLTNNLQTHRHTRAFAGKRVGKASSPLSSHGR